MPDFRHPDFFSFIDGQAVKTAARVLKHAEAAETPSPDQALPEIPAALAALAAVRSAESQ